MFIHLKANGETEYSRKYYELAKAAAKSPSELEGLEALKRNALKNAYVNDYKIPFWMDNRK